MSNVSVVVPVYKTEEYLEKCLASLAAQTLDGIEIIVVNDGSPDNSQKIIDAFADKHPDKIRALKQENKGLGAARNFGVERSQGDYIGFVDSDDWVSHEMFELMYHDAKAKDSDIVICDIRCVSDYKNENRTFRGWPGRKEAPETIADFVLYSTNPAYSWNKIYKRELLQKTPFPTGYYEDIATTPIILSYCKKISYLKKPLYYYLRRGGGSISAQSYSPNNLRVIDAWRRCLDKGNPKYKEEVAYAVYYSIKKFLEYKPDCSSAYLEFFHENAASFEGNGYIREAIQKYALTDMFKVISPHDETLREASPYAQNIADFLDETAVLIGQIEMLPKATASELYNMYNATLQLAVENISEVGWQMIKQLCDRQATIRAKITNN